MIPIWRLASSCTQFDPGSHYLLISLYLFKLQGKVREINYTSKSQNTPSITNIFLTLTHQIPWASNGALTIDLLLRLLSTTIKIDISEKLMSCYLLKAWFVSWILANKFSHAWRMRHNFSHIMYLLNIMRMPEYSNLYRRSTTHLRFVSTSFSPRLVAWHGEWLPIARRFTTSLDCEQPWNRNYITWKWFRLRLRLLFIELCHFISKLEYFNGIIPFL